MISRGDINFLQPGKSNSISTLRSTRPNSERSSNGLLYYIVLTFTRDKLVGHTASNGDTFQLPLPIKNVLFGLEIENTIRRSECPIHLSNFPEIFDKNHFLLF